MNSSYIKTKFGTRSLVGTNRGFSRTVAAVNMNMASFDKVLGLFATPRAESGSEAAATSWRRAQYHRS